MNTVVLSARMIHVDPIRFTKTGSMCTIARVRTDFVKDNYELDIAVFGNRLVLLLKNLGAEPDCPVLIQGRLRYKDGATTPSIKTPFYIEVENLEFRSLAEDEVNMKVEIERYKERKKLKGGEDVELPKEAINLL